MRKIRRTGGVTNMGYAAKLGSSSSPSLEYPLPYYLVGLEPEGNAGAILLSFEMGDTPSESKIGVFKILSLKNTNTLHIYTNSVLNSSMGGAGTLYIAIMQTIPTTLSEMQADSTFQSFDLNYGYVWTTYTIPNSVKDGSIYYIIIYCSRVYWYSGGTYYPYRSRYLQGAYID